MHYSTISGAAVLLALAPSTLAVGVASVYNNCGFDVWYAATAATYEAMALLPASGYSQEYSDPGQGVSIKLATSDSLTGPISQFEFTWSGDSIFYDLSNINGDDSSTGYPFAEGGVIIQPSMTNDPANPTCEAVECPAGSLVCSAAYNAPDDTDTMVCNQESNLVLTLCPAGGAKAKRTPEPVSETHVLHSHQRIHARHLPKK